MMRPFGGMLIGYMGDKHGRKHALVLSLFLMAVPTFVMGCLPTYEQVGVLSTVLLVICRLLQGMSVGGQLPASLIYTVETRPKEKWGFYGSLVMMAANIGTLLGNFVGAILRSSLTEEQLLSWGWRIPFLSGILIALVAVYLKLHGEEHHPNAGIYDSEPSGEGDQLEESKHPLRESFRRENLPALVSATLTPMLWGAGVSCVVVSPFSSNALVFTNLTFQPEKFYLSFVWLAIFMNDIMQPPMSNAFWINGMALLFGVTLPLPLTGILSDYCGRVRTMVAGALLLGGLGPILLIVITYGEPVKAFFAQWGIGILLSLYGGPISAWLVEKFPPKVRLTSASLGYDLAHCSASAFAPLIATLLAQNVSLIAPGVIYPFFAILGLIGMFTSTKIHQDGGLDDLEMEVSEMDDDLQKEVRPEGEEEEVEKEIV